MTFFLEERQRIKMKRNEKISFYQRINLVQSKQSHFFAANAGRRPNLISSLLYKQNQYPKNHFCKKTTINEIKQPTMKKFHL